MKQMQKLTCLLLALLMVLSLSVTAFAAEGDTPGAGGENPVGNPEKGSITLTNAAPGETYKLYKILDLESYNKVENTEIIGGETVIIDNGQYSYKIADGWANFFATSEAKVYFNEVLDDTGVGTGYVRWIKTPYTGTDVVNFSQLALKYAETNSITPVEIYVCPGTVGGATVSYTFSNLSLGYYLLDSTLGSLCSLTTTNPDVSIIDKNTVPDNDKKVQEGSEWKTANDAAIGDTVNYRSIVNIESGIENLIYHDKMSDGLTFKPNSVKVVLDPTDTKASNKQTELIPNKHYKVVTKTDAEGNLVPLEDGCTFHIEFFKVDDETAGTVDFYKLITTGEHVLNITYSATLNENAVVRGDGNKNECHLSYGNDNHATPWKETVTKTWSVPIWKYKLDGSNMVGLAGVKFTLSLNEDGTTPIKLIECADRMENATDKDGNFILDGSGNNVKEAWKVYRIATEEEINDPTVTKVEKIVTGDTGKFWIEGLDSKTYYLTETDPLDGYQGLDKPITIVMSSDGTFKKNESAASVILIQNSSGSKLPSTGGIGTTIFYVVGSVLLVGAGILLITKKRMSAEA